MTITINGSPQPQFDLPINTLTQLDTDLVGSYLWTILDQPNLSTATLSSITAKNPTITPDVSGTYMFRCVVGGSITEYAIFSVAMKRSFQRVPAAGEGDPALGGALAHAKSWAYDRNRWLRYLNRNMERGSQEVCYNDSGGALNQGDLVYVKGVHETDSGLPEAHFIPAVDKASAAAASTLAGVGIVLGKAGYSATSALAGELVVIGFSGLAEGVNTAGRTVGDPVYASDTPGAISFSAGTVEHIVGYVAFVGASPNGKIAMYPQGAAGSGGGGGGTPIIVGLVGEAEYCDYYHEYGVTDAIALAIAEATSKGGGVIYFRQGVYQTDSAYTLTQQIKIQGEDPSLSIIELMNGDLSGNPFITVSSDNCTFENIWVRMGVQIVSIEALFKINNKRTKFNNFYLDVFNDVAGFNEGYIFIASGAENTFFEGCVIGSLVQRSIDYLYTEHIKGLFINNCEMYGTFKTDYIFLTNPDENIRITNSIFKSNTYTSIPYASLFYSYVPSTTQDFDGLYIEGNIIENCSMYFETDTYNFKNTKIIGNTFKCDSNMYSFMDLWQSGDKLFDSFIISNNSFHFDYEKPYNQLTYLYACRNVTVEGNNVYVTKTRCKGFLIDDSINISVSNNNILYEASGLEDNFASIGIEAWGLSDGNINIIGNNISSLNNGVEKLVSMQGIKVGYGSDITIAANSIHIEVKGRTTPNYPLLYSGYGTYGIGLYKGFNASWQGNIRNRVNIIGNNVYVACDGVSAFNGDGSCIYVESTYDDPDYYLWNNVTITKNSLYPINYQDRGIHIPDQYTIARIGSNVIKSTGGLDGSNYFEISSDTRIQFHSGNPFDLVIGNSLSHNQQDCDLIHYNDSFFDAVAIAFKIASKWYNGGTIYFKAGHYDTTGRLELVGPVRLVGEHYYGPGTLHDANMTIISYTVDDDVIEGSLLTGVSPGALSITLQAGEGALFPSTFPYEIILDRDGPGTREIATVTSKSVDTLNLQSPLQFGHLINASVSFHAVSFISGANISSFSAENLVFGIEGDPNYSSFIDIRSTNLTNPVSMVTFKNCTFSDYSFWVGPNFDRYLYIENTQNLVIDNCEFEEVYCGHVYINKAYHCTIRNTYFEGNGGFNLPPLHVKNFESLFIENNSLGSEGEWTDPPPISATTLVPCIFLESDTAYHLVCNGNAFFNNGKIEIASNLVSGGQGPTRHFNISNNHFETVPSYSIRFLMTGVGGDSTFNDIVISGNTFYGVNTGSPPSQQLYGIDFRNTIDDLSGRIVVSNNTFKFPSGVFGEEKHFVFMEKMNGVAISGNIVEIDNSGADDTKSLWGVKLVNCNGISVSGNSFYDRGADRTYIKHVELLNCNNVAVSSNQFYGSGAYNRLVNILGTSEGIAVSGNHFFVDNYLAGVSARSVGVKVADTCKIIDISGNSIQCGTNVVGILLEGTGGGIGVTASGNQFSAEDSSVLCIDVENNWKCVTVGGNAFFVSSGGVNNGQAVRSGGTGTSIIFTGNNVYSKSGGGVVYTLNTGDMVVTDGTYKLNHFVAF